MLALVGSIAAIVPTKRARLEAVGLERVLVDLDPEAGTRGRVEHAVAELALDRGDRRGEEALGGEAVARSPLAGQGSGSSSAARRAPSAIPTGPSSALEA